MKLGEGSHKEIALDLRKKRQENQQKTDNLLRAISEVYHCSENDIDRILGKYPDLKKEFQIFNFSFAEALAAAREERRSSNLTFNLKLCPKF